MVEGSVNHGERPRVASQADPFRLIRMGIWLYLFLWLIEGGLRRWFLPGLATPLLVVRDPVALAIYWLALKQGVWPRNILVTAMLFLAPLSWMLATTVGHGNLVIATYGVRCDFLHVPLIFIIARVMRRKDLDGLCKVALWISIPYTLLLILQFYSPQSAWVNRGLGGSTGGAGFSGALGKFRPPGTFSFITGPAQLYPMFCAAWFYLLCRRKLSFALMGLAGGAILLAIPFSISRSLLFGELLVASAGCAALVAGGSLTPQLLGRAAIGGVIALAIVVLTPGTSEAFAAFGVRWKSATTQHGGMEHAILGRVLGGIIEPFSTVGTIGSGTGISTQAGQKLLTGERGFGESEGEWGRILAEGGVLLGFPILGFRMLLLAFICWRTCRAMLRAQFEALPMLVPAAQFLLLGQWGQTTSLGSSIIACGICLASTKNIRQSINPVCMPKSRHRRTLVFPVDHASELISRQVNGLVKPTEGR
ncbi:hypothetical protein NZK35_03665 [Stieleria sp. ICT_E10.1]|uniref:hypothetical protein n=1 Tax=Stieleria sedimenti TaxID=2976331 RepID=UPI00217FD0AF|nr:hypothetical protein [Stieleria sedimenti]MCS7465772.1 hypothetical protein [Stieleria sedimenti]